MSTSRLLAVFTSLSLTISGLAGAHPALARTGSAPGTNTEPLPDVCLTSTSNLAAPKPAGLPDVQVIVSPSDPQARTVAYDGASLKIRPSAVRWPVGIGISRLNLNQVPRLDPEMVNVTAKPRGGYRFTPHPMQFAEAIEVSIPYDPALIGDEFTPQDIYTYFYDDVGACWQRLQRVRVDEVQHLVVSLTDHFTDMINATVTVPEHPEGMSFNPNQIKGIQAASPATGVNLIAPPGAGSEGNNRLSYSIEIPPGRQGLQPALVVGYDSSRANGWMGVGWDITAPAITIDTRWGVPRYQANKESETYMLNGGQLTPVAHRGVLENRTSDKVFHSRVEGDFAKIVRRGSTPSEYFWEVTDKAGTVYTYGNAASSVLSDSSGNDFLWALRSVRDTHGNTMLYEYAKVDDPGVDGGAEPGSNLYLQRITYSEHYSVKFVRDRELGENLRLDKTIDARGGFKRVTADRLRKIEVSLDATPIRSYEFAYTTGAFHKTLLSSLTQLDANGAAFATHRFEYFDDIRDAQGGYQAFQQSPWSVPGDDLKNDLLSLTGAQAGDASAINANTSIGGGGHLYVGVGVGSNKSGSVGLKVGFSHDDNEGLLALIDVDGDSLPDKVFRDGDTVFYRKNLSGPRGSAAFSSERKQLSLPAIFGENSDSLNLGIEGYLSGVAAQLNYVATFATTDQYFSDVNGDGIMDLVNGASVLFGRLGPDGVPVYGVSGDTPVPITAGALDPNGLFGDFAAQRERLIDSFPLLDTVRRWVAPYDGVVRIEGGVKLADETAGQRATSRVADGVRAAIQLENTQLWSETIAPQDNTVHDPDGVEAIAVTRGQRLYFRLQSNSDGGLDEVSWDPVVTYTGVPSTLDPNGLDFYRYQASRDFTLGGRTSEAKVPLTGVVHLDGDLTLSGTTTDTVTALITLDGLPVTNGTDVSVTAGQTLKWRVVADSPVDLNKVDWTPHLFYVSAQGVDRVTDPRGRPIIELFPPYDVDMYPVDGLSAPQGFRHVDSDSTLTVDPQLTVSGSPTGRVTFTVKKRGALVAKRFFDIANGIVTSPGSFSVDVLAGDDLFFDFSTRDPALRDVITAQSVTVNGADVPSALHSAAKEDAFAQPYRGWGAIGYNGNRDRAGQPIVQADLVVDDNFRDQLPSTVDPQGQKDAFAADPRINPPKAAPFLPQPQHRRWSAGEHSWVTRDHASSSRLGVDSIALPRPQDLAGSTGIPRMAFSQQVSVTGSVGGPIGSIGGSIATGDSTGETDFFDLNGDQFPDVVGSGGVQYTDATGGLGGTRGSLPDGAVRRSTNISGNASAGSAARTIETGKGYGSPPGTTPANTTRAGNDMPPLGVGGSLGDSSSEGKFDLLDVNGDGLPDRIYSDGRVALNLGYRFGQPEQWRHPAALNDGSGTNEGVNIGFNTDFYGLAGGGSYSEGNTSSGATLMDVNGDGLLDRVFEGSPIRVGLNTGNGFEAPVPFHGSGSKLNNDQNAKLGAGAYFKIPICFTFVCVIINPGADISTGASRSEVQIKDVNGDGYADHVASNHDDEMVVAQNKTGRTNLLRAVSRPLGARMDFDYTRDGNTYDLPQSHWLLTRVSVNDGKSGDGQDVRLTTFDYSGGRYDRLEREFLGYANVVERHRNPAAGEAVYRSVTREFLNDNHYDHGLLRREVTTDAAGRLFTETINTYVLHEVGGGTADPHSTTATVHAQLVRTDKKFYEGTATAGKATFSTMEYDEFGNIVRQFEAGDTGTADDTDARISYTTTVPECLTRHIVGTPTAIQAFGGGVLMRDRESSVDCTNGDVTQIRAKLANGDVSATDMQYFPDGNLRAVISPPNKVGQRYRLDYTYDATVRAHVESVLDSFAYRSSSTYDLRFGLVATNTDMNGQTVTNVYDSVGRLDTVTGPYEAGEGRVTIDFEYHPEASTPYAVTRHADRESDGTPKADTLDTITFTDGLGRVLQTKKDAAVSTGEASLPADVMVVSGRLTFDFVGRAVQQFYPITEAKGGNTSFNDAFDTVRPTAFSYDVLDRTVRMDLPNNTFTATSFGFGPDRAGVTQFETVSTDANGNNKRTYSDVRQLTTAIKEFNPAGGQPVIWTSYGYNALEQPTTVTDDRNNVTTSAYDNLGRRTVVDSPDSGRTETRYDLAGNTIAKVTEKLAATGQAVEYDYDFNRLRGIRYPIFPANNVTYTYGPPGAANNGANRVTHMVDGAGVVDREYGPLGELTEETRTSAAQGSHVFTFTTSYRYDTWNRMLSMTFPDGEVLSYHYNSGGLVDSATGFKSTFTYPYLRRSDYDKFEMRVLLDTGNGTRTANTYRDDDRRLDNLRSTLSNGYVFQNLNYEYDNVGNVTSIQNDTQAPTGPDVGMQVGGPSTQTFRYDQLYQLTHAEGTYQPRTPQTDRYRVDLSYDSIHNITSKNQVHEMVSNGNTIVENKLTYNYNYTYGGAQPHAPTTLGIYTIAYDANGNQISRDQQPKPRRQMIWDEENRLACSHENVQNQTLPQTPASCDNAGGTPNNARYFYDDQGTRVIKDGAQFHIYPNQNYSTKGVKQYKHVYIGQTKLVTKFVEPDQRIEDRQYYTHADHLGSATFITNDQGTMSEHLLYFPGGETWVSEHPSMPVPQQFTGKELDSETKLYYYGARYYDPRTQVWQTPDPLIESYMDGAPNGGVHTSVNLAAYTYAANNPVALKDPTGQAWSDFWQGAKSGAINGIVVGVGVGIVVATAPAWVTTGLVVAGAAGLAYTAYRAYNADGAERSRIAGELVGGAITGGIATAGAKVATTAAVSAARTWLAGAAPRSLGAAAAAAEETTAAAAETLFHYTSREALPKIVGEQSLRVTAARAANTRHPELPAGQYFTDIAPEMIGPRLKADLTEAQKAAGMMSRLQMVNRIFGTRPHSGLEAKTSKFLEINTEGLGVRQVSPNIFVRESDEALSLAGRIVRTGDTPP